jgi:hypothetical protein
MRYKFLFRGASMPDGKRPNREHGADHPIGAKTVTAPATVSGEAKCMKSHWETGKVARGL